MNRRQTDVFVGVLVAAILVVGGALTWQAYQQQRALDQMGSMMGSSMTAIHGTNPLWYVLGTVLVVGVVIGGYLVYRPALTPIASVGRSLDDAEQGDHPMEDDSESGGTRTSETTREDYAHQRLLDLLPDDERRVLEPVLTSPGITQIELRDRSDFSKSKVSQTVTDLEKRGLLYRERQGRTYRVYPSEHVQDE